VVVVCSFLVAIVFRIRLRMKSREHLLFSIFGCKFLHLLNGLYSDKKKMFRGSNQFSCAVIDEFITNNHLFSNFWLLLLIKQNLYLRIYYIFLASYDYASYKIEWIESYMSFIGRNGQVPFWALKKDYNASFLGSNSFVDIFNLHYTHTVLLIRCNYTILVWAGLPSCYLFRISHQTRIIIDPYMFL